MNIRYHHFSDISALYSRYKNWSTLKDVTVPFQDLFTNIATLEQYLSDYREPLRRDILARYKKDSFVNTFEELRDYAGQHAEYIEPYVNGLMNFYRNILTMQPDQEVKLTYDNDHICENCQHKLEGTNAGEHCEKQRYLYTDVAYDMSLSYLMTQKDHSEIRREPSLRGNSYILPVGTLRNPIFITMLTNISEGRRELMEWDPTFYVKNGILDHGLRGNHYRASDLLFAGTFSGLARS